MGKPLPEGLGAAWQAVGAHVQRCRFQLWSEGVWDSAAGTKGVFHWLTPHRAAEANSWDAFYGLLPMHRQSWAPNNLLPLKALHSQPGWKDVKEKAMHMVKCKGARKQGGQSAPQEPPGPRLGARARSPGVWTSSRAAARLLRNGHKSWERR